MNVDDILNESSSDQSSPPQSSSNSSQPGSANDVASDQENVSGKVSAKSASSSEQSKHEERKESVTESMKKSLSEKDLLKNASTDEAIENQLDLDKDLVRAKRATIQDSSKFKTFTDVKKATQNDMGDFFETNVGMDPSPSKIDIDQKESSVNMASSMNESKKKEEVERQIEEKMN